MLLITKGGYFRHWRIGINFRNFDGFDWFLTDWCYFWWKSDGLVLSFWRIRIDASEARKMNPNWRNVDGLKNKSVKILKCLLKFWFLFVKNRWRKLLGFTSIWSKWLFHCRMALSNWRNKNDENIPLTNYYSLHFD